MSTDPSFLSQFAVSPDQRRPLAMLGGLVALLVLFYWSTLGLIAMTWKQPEYSHGWLVPLFAAVLLWMQREPITEATPSGRMAGFALLLGGLGMRLTGAYVGYAYVDMVSLLPCLFGVFLIVGGWQLLRWAGPALGFFVFMYPLPGVVSRTLLGTLQKFATILSTFALQTMGISAFRSGNRIGGEVELNVVDTCSGLRMATIFLALAVAVTMITARPLWQRIIIIISSVPIAILVNVIRITGTGVVQLTLGQDVANLVHDTLAGWIMMPLAMGFLFLELQILSNLIIEDEVDTPMSIGGMPAGMPRVGGRT